MAGSGKLCKHGRVKSSRQCDSSSEGFFLCCTRMISLLSEYNYNMVRIYKQKRRVVPIIRDHPSFLISCLRLCPDQISGSAVISSGFGIPMNFKIVGATLQRAPSFTVFTESPALITMNCTGLSEWAVFGVPSSLTA